MALLTPETLEVLRAAEQCIADTLHVYDNGAHAIPMREAMRSLRFDALPKIRLALKMHEDAQIAEWDAAEAVAFHAALDEQAAENELPYDDTGDRPTMADAAVGRL